MKKLFYLVSFVFLFIILGVNNVDAKEMCYYKTNDNKIAMAVVMDGTDGNAYLMKPYSKSDGFVDNQAYEASWKIINVDEKTGCSDYLFYEMTAWANYVYADDNLEDYDIENHYYLLTKFDINESDIIRCVYKDQMVYTNRYYNYTVQLFDGFMFTYFGDDYDLKEDENYSAWDLINFRERFTYGPSKTFYDDFIKSFNEVGKCPSISTASGSSHAVKFYPGDGTDPMALISEEYPEDIDVNEVVKEYRKHFVYKENQTDIIELVFRAYKDKTEEFCVAQYFNGNDRPDERCINTKEYRNGTASVDNMNFSIKSQSGEFINLYMESREIPRFFAYRDENDPSTLIDPGTIYYEEKRAQSYLITKTVTDSSSEHLGLFSGETYKNHVCELSFYLNKIGVSDGKSLNINGINKPLSNWGCGDNYTCNGEECDNTVYMAEKKAKSIRAYCNDVVYRKYGVDPSPTLKVRMKECISFNEYYTWLVEKNYINNLGANCGLISNDFAELLIKILDIVKIAGPIIAIILGMLDFVKVIVSGDPDKENKKAFNSFVKRIIAACLLFLVPMLLSILMNFFLTGQQGYDPDNPFCGIDWSQQ